MKICEAGRSTSCCRNPDIRTINTMGADTAGNFEIRGGSNINVNTITNGVEISAVLPSYMMFKGTVGTGGTIPSLPSADPANTGYAYLAVSSATSPVTYDVGDLVVSNGSSWVVVPSGDDILPIVTSWQTPPDDAHVPSEKLVKDTIDALPELELFLERTGLSSVAPANTETEITHTLPTGYQFDKGYDYFIFFTSGSSNSGTIRLSETLLVGNSTTFKTAVLTPTGTIYWGYKLYRYPNDSADPNVRIVGSSLVSTVPVGGDLTWTQRTSNNDWSDIFENSSGLLKAKKHIIFNSGSQPHFSLTYIPKGLTTNNIHIECPQVKLSGSTFTVYQDMTITTSNITGPSIIVAGKAYAFTTDGVTVSIAESASNTNYGKSSFKIFTAD